jgi:ATPase subunit of ABC transporter with duplicated ATPase domains
MSYGVAEDDEACAALCAKVYQTVSQLVKPSGHSSNDADDNGPLALLEAPVLMRHTTGQALTEEQDASVVDKLGRALIANSGKGLPQEVVVKNTTARARKAAKAQRELDDIRSWKVEEDDEEALDALDVYLNAIDGKARFVGDINLNDVALQQPKTTNNLLEGAQLRLVSGRRYGLIGRNGIGKVRPLGLAGSML